MKKCATLSLFLKTTMNKEFQRGRNGFDSIREAMTATGGWSDGLLKIRPQTQTANSTLPRPSRKPTPSLPSSAMLSVVSWPQRKRLATHAAGNARHPGGNNRAKPVSSFHQKLVVEGEVKTFAPGKPEPAQAKQAMVVEVMEERLEHGGSTPPGSTNQRTCEGTVSPSRLAGIKGSHERQQVHLF